MTWKRKFKYGDRVLHQNHGIARVEFETQAYVEIAIEDGGRMVKVSPHTISQMPNSGTIEERKKEIRQNKGEWVENNDAGGKMCGEDGT